MEIMDIGNLTILYNHWISQRDYIRDCRWTAKHNQDVVKFENFDTEYKKADIRVKAIRKAIRKLYKRGV